MIEQNDTPDLSKQEEKAHRIAALILGYIRHALTAEEHDELDEWVGESDKNMSLFEELTDENATQAALDWLTDADGPRMLNKIKSNLTFTAPRRRFFSKMWHYAVAASAVLLVGTALVWLSKNKTTETKTPIAVVEKQDIAPGRDQATLTLADGRNIILDQVKDGKLATEGNTDITKQNGQLLYDKNTGASNNTVALQTLTIPRGGSYSLTLSDGTKIWLNAASSITFPAVFSGNERRVAITGEVYFEVAKVMANSKPPSPKGVSGRVPFIVEVKDKGMAVEVLGTHFNINAYNDETYVKTTLLEGAVKVESGNGVSFLKPNQQAQVSTAGEIKTVKDIDIMQEVAWKDGFFRFKDENITTIMRQLSRWYNVDVEFEGKKSMTGYNCILARNIPVSTILKTLEETGGVHFTIEGNKIKVLP